MSTSDGVILTFQRMAPDAVVIGVTGDLDMATAPQVQAYVREHTTNAAAHLVLDLSGVSFFSSSGAALLIALATDAQQTGANCT